MDEKQIRELIQKELRLRVATLKLPKHTMVSLQLAMGR